MEILSMWKKKQVILGFGVIQIRMHVLVALHNKIDYEYGNWDYKSKESTRSWGNKESESTESWGDKELELWLEKGELRSLRARGDHSSCRSESGLEPPQLSLLSLLPQLQEHPPSFLMWLLFLALELGGKSPSIIFADCDIVCGFVCDSFA